MHSWKSLGTAVVVAATLASSVVGIVEAVPSSAESSCGTPTACAVGALANLRNTVVDVVTDPGLANSLTAKVDAATKNVLAGNTRPALNEVGAFENETSGNPLLQLVSDVLKAASDSAKAQIANIK